MPQRVLDEDGRVHTFPDGVSPDEIKKQLQKFRGASASPEPPEPESPGILERVGNAVAPVFDTVVDTVLPARPLELLEKVKVAGSEGDLLKKLVGGFERQGEKISEIDSEPGLAARAKFLSEANPYSYTVGALRNFANSVDTQQPVEPGRKSLVEKRSELAAALEAVDSPARRRLGVPGSPTQGPYTERQRTLAAQAAQVTPESIQEDVLATAKKVPLKPELPVQTAAMFPARAASHAIEAMYLDPVGAGVMGGQAGITKLASKFLPKPAAALVNIATNLGSAGYFGSDMLRGINEGLEQSGDEGLQQYFREALPAAAGTAGIVTHMARGIGRGASTVTDTVREGRSLKRTEAFLQEKYQSGAKKRVENEQGGRPLLANHDEGELVAYFEGDGAGKELRRTQNVDDLSTAVRGLFSGRPDTKVTIHENWDSVPENLRPRSPEALETIPSLIDKSTGEIHFIRTGQKTGSGLARNVRHEVGHAVDDFSPVEIVRSLPNGMRQQVALLAQEGRLPMGEANRIAGLSDAALAAEVKAMSANPETAWIPQTLATEAVARIAQDFRVQPSKVSLLMAKAARAMGLQMTPSDIRAIMSERIEQSKTGERAPDVGMRGTIPETARPDYVPTAEPAPAVEPVPAPVNAEAFNLSGTGKGKLSPPDKRSFAAYEGGYSQDGLFFQNTADDYKFNRPEANEFMDDATWAALADNDATKFNLLPDRRHEKTDADGIARLTDENGTKVFALYDGDRLLGSASLAPHGLVRYIRVARGAWNPERHPFWNLDDRGKYLAIRDRRTPFMNLQREMARNGVVRGADDALSPSGARNLNDRVIPDDHMVNTLRGFENSPSIIAGETGLPLDYVSKGIADLKGGKYDSIEAFEVMDWVYDKIREQYEIDRGLKPASAGVEGRPVQGVPGDRDNAGDAEAAPGGGVGAGGTAAGAAAELAPFPQAEVPLPPAEVAFQNTAADVSPLGFYSKLRREVEGGQNKWRPDDLLRFLKARGVKPEEMEWSRLDGLLAGKTSVTKAEVLEHLAENSIKVEEKVLWNKDRAEFSRLQELKRRAYERDFVARGAFQEAQAELKPGDPASIQAFKDARREMMEAREERTTAEAALEEVRKKLAEPETKYSSYTLPGGKNYRELLLTMPERTATASLDFVDWFRRPRQLSRQLAERYLADMERTERGRAALAEERAKHRKAEGNVTYRSGNFESSHFSEPNILAHVRFNERTGPNGERVLHIEEVQSDWHQQGREKGYSIPSEEANVKLLALQKALGEKYGVPIEFDSDNVITGRSEMALLSKMTEAERESYGHIGRSKHGFGGVPDAPFKDNKWEDLALKRMLRWAADEGFDRITWTTGDQQAHRYKEALLKAIDEVRVTRWPDGRYEYRATKDGHGVASETTATAKEIRATFGKAGDQIVEAADATPGKEATVRAEDMHIGGRGMRTAYDERLVNKMNDLARKLDPTMRVGEGEIDTGAAGARVHSLDLTPKAREAAKAGFSLFQNTAADQYGRAPKSLLDPMRGTLLQLGASVIDKHPTIESFVSKMSEGLDGGAKLSVQQMAASIFEDVKTYKAEADNAKSILDALRSKAEPKKQLGTPEAGSARDILKAVDAANERAGLPASKDDAKTIKQATTWVESVGADGVMDRVLEAVRNHRQLEDYETLGARLAFGNLADREAALSDPKSAVKQFLMAAAYRQAGTEQARAFRMRRWDIGLEGNDRVRHALFDVFFDPKGIRDNAIAAEAREAIATGRQPSGRATQKIMRHIAKVREFLEKEIGVKNVSDIPDGLLTDPVYMKNLVDEWSHKSAGVGAKMRTWYLNSILSAPKTQVANITGNTLNFVTEYYGHLRAEALVNDLFAAFKSDTGGVRSSDLKGLMSQLIRVQDMSFRQAAELGKIELDAGGGLMGRAGKDAVKFWKTREAQLRSRIEKRDWVDELREKKQSFGGKSGKIIQAPTKALGFADEFMKSLTGHMEALISARRIARVEGRAVGSEGYNSRVTELLSDYGSAAWAEALDRAEYMTFQREGGKLVKSLLAFRHAHPWTSFIVPFITTPVNLFSRAFEFVPGLGMMYRGRHGQTVWEAKGTDQGGYKSRMIAAQAMGAAATLMIGALGLDAFKEGEDEPWITGSEPPPKFSQGEREARRRTLQPYTVKNPFGEGRISYKRLDPLSTTLAVSVDFTHALRDFLRHKDPSRAGAILKQSLLGQAVGKTFLQTPGEVIEWIQDKPGTDPLGPAKTVASGFYPNLFRSAANSFFDPFVREQRNYGAKEGELGMDPLERQAKTFAYKTLNIPELPGVGTLVEPKATVYGDRVKRGGSGPYRFLSPFDIYTPSSETQRNMDLRFLRSVETLPDAPDSLPVEMSPKARLGGQTIALRPEDFLASEEASGRLYSEILRNAGIAHDPTKPLTEAELEIVKRVARKVRPYGTHTVAPKYLGGR